MFVFAVFCWRPAPPSSNLALTYYHHKRTKSKQISYNHFFEFHTWILESVHVVKNMWFNDLLIQNTSKHWLWFCFKTYEIAAPEIRPIDSVRLPLNRSAQHSPSKASPWTSFAHKFESLSKDHADLDVTPVGQSSVTTNDHGCNPNVWIWDVHVHEIIFIWNVRDIRAVRCA